MSQTDASVVHTSFIGVDVSKAELEVCVLPGGEVRTLENDEAGVNQMVEFLQEFPNAAIAIEALRALNMGPAILAEPEA